MNGSHFQSTARSVHDIANELCELYQLQIEALQQATTAEMEKYIQRRDRIAELRARLEALRQRPS
jgi:hypothetical protein